MSPKARTTVRPFSVRPDASPTELAHARGLNEGMLRKVNRIKQEISTREALARKLVKKIGLRNKRIAELEVALTECERQYQAKVTELLAEMDRSDHLKALLAKALPNLADYAIMVADQPGSLWQQIFAATCETKTQSETSSTNSVDSAHKAGSGD